MFVYPFFIYFQNMCVCFFFFLFLLNFFHFFFHINFSLFIAQFGFSSKEMYKSIILYFPTLIFPKKPEVTSRNGLVSSWFLF
jgi:hypothetical protein